MSTKNHPTALISCCRLLVPFDILVDRGPRSDEEDAQHIFAPSISRYYCMAYCALRTISSPQGRLLKLLRSRQLKAGWLYSLGGAGVGNLIRACCRQRMTSVSASCLSTIGVESEVFTSLQQSCPMMCAGATRELSNPGTKRIR